MPKKKNKHKYKPKNINHNKTPVSKNVETKTNDIKPNKNNKQKLFVTIIVWLLVIATIGGMVVPIFISSSYDEHAGHDHSESSSEVILYTEEDYEANKDKDIISKETDITISDDWQFAFGTNEDNSIQVHYYLYNEYNNIVIERINSSITKENIKSYYDNVVKTFATEPEGNIELGTPYIKEHSFEEKDDSYYIDINYNIYEEKEDTEFVEGNQENQIAVIENNYRTYIKFISGKNVSYMITFNGYYLPESDSIEVLGIDEIFNSFKILE